MLGLDVGAGLASGGFIFGLFGPTYLAGRPEHTRSLREASGARGHFSLGGILRRGPMAARLEYADGLGREAISFDRQFALLIDLGDLSVGGAQVLELRASIAARSPFRPDARAVAAAAAARLRWSHWLAGEAFLQAGVAFSAGLGLAVTWVP